MPCLLNRALAASSLLLMISVTGPSRAAEATNAAAASTNVHAASGAFDEQQDLVQQAIEQTRRDAEAGARQQMNALSARLNSIEESILRRHEAEMARLQESSRTTLIVAGALAGVALIGVGFLGFFLVRTTNRLAEIQAGGPYRAPIGAGTSTPLLTAGEMAPALQAGARFLGAVEQLERRLHEMESVVQSPGPVRPEAPPAAAARPGAAATAATPVAPGPIDVTEVRPPKGVTGINGNGNHESPAPVEAGGASATAQVSVLLAKGDTCLSLQKAAEALECFEEALRLAPSSTEALLKRGAAMEKLGKLDDAMLCYDRAIAVDGAFTAAYLHKGAVFNRLERHQEALACYELALKVGAGPGPEVVGGKRPL